MKMRLAISAALACLMTCLSWAAQAQGDPPASIARLNVVSGAVSVAPAGADQWIDANPNRPLTTGDDIWADRGSRAELQIDSTLVRLDSQTNLSLLDVGDRNVQLKVTQGAVNVRLLEYDPNQPVEVDTPNLAFVPRSAGEYRLDVEPDGTTAVTVRRGTGSVYGDNAAISIGPRQRFRFAGTNLQLLAGAAGPGYDDFDRWAAERDRLEDNSPSARYVPRGMVGYESLDAYGVWQTDPGYGAVWVPTVTSPGWAPYRDGHWVWIAPWGWTWVDDEPWGFAPFHYGRWAYVRERWCWVPGPVNVRPVYAPALVAWVGGDHDDHWSVTLATGVPGIGWFPLGPGDAYRPSYRVSNTYIERVNRTVIINKTINRNTYITNNVSRTVYVNQHVHNAITTVPAAAFVQGRPVVSSAVAMAPGAAARMRVGTSPDVTPVARSVMGDARQARHAPPHDIVARQVLALRTPPAPHSAFVSSSGASVKPQAEGHPLTLNSAAAGRPRPVREGVKVLSSVPRPRPVDNVPRPAAGPRVPGAHGPQGATQGRPRPESPRGAGAPALAPRTTDPAPHAPYPSPSQSPRPLHRPSQIGPSVPERPASPPRAPRQQPRDLQPYGQQPHVQQPHVQQPHVQQPHVPQPHVQQPRPASPAYREGAHPAPAHGEPQRQRDEKRDERRSN
ncbi:MAG: hypothetical protein KGQ45_01475 [Burkholderiales bacterium]|nr:hypothetical protein [Burkholderiales bacterium]